MVAVHAEDRIGDDESAARRMPREQLVERADVGVRIDVHGRAREPAAVDDARVVQLVAEDGVAAADERRDGADVGVVAGREEQRRPRCA